MSPLPIGSTIGILGGGQLGRMLCIAASRLGMVAHILSPDPDPPAKEVALHHTHASYEDQNRASDFARACDVVTYEFENIPSQLALSLSSITPLYPPAKALNIAQDRLIEKSFIQDIANVPVTNFCEINSRLDLEKAVQTLGLPCVLKTRHFGYDGKGQFVIKSLAEIDIALAAMKDAPAILECFVPFTREISIICARNTCGDTSAYPLIENIHTRHILHKSTAPAENDNGQAQAYAVDILEALNYVGVLAVEFFELKDGSVLVNEIAPRVHNSGHWTQDAGCIDQFELHIRAICGWPLGDTSPKHKVEMTNLLGHDIESCPQYADQPSTFIHLYGKKHAREDRKMGHINRLLS